MGKYYKEDKWKKWFGILLKQVCSCYNINDGEFAKKYDYHESTIRYWKNGTNYPRKDAFDNLKMHISSIADDDIESLPSQIDLSIKSIFEDTHNMDYYCHLKELHKRTGDFINDVLTFIYDSGKNILYISQNNDAKKLYGSKKTQAVIFDFDGTLTSEKTNKTTWECIWTELGYEINECKSLHMRFDKKEITHSEWCKLTEDKFRKKHLHRADIENIAQNIPLLDGVEETFIKLRDNNIKIYIVSGSILLIIQRVLGDLFKYIDGVQANKFHFDINGFLTEIEGTPYDFEGKAQFIREIADDLNISTDDILFVGNSINDQFAYLSGVRTLCINPVLTDIYNTKVWNNSIVCDDLKDILEYVTM